MAEAEGLSPGPIGRPSTTPVPSPSKGPLAGTLVLDFTGYIAGSYSTMLLAQMGADVIKVESLVGDGFRFAAFAFQGWNQNKRAIAIDLRHASGREIAYALAKKADMVVENFRPGNARELGVDYETLAAINPRLVYVSINGFGSSGPDFDQPSFDPVLQARSGVMMAHDGRLRGRPPIHPIVLNLPFCDYGAAALGALAGVLALGHQRRTGKGQHCEVTLIHSAIALQAGEFIFYDGRPNLESGAPEARGTSALRRVYQCDGGRWIFLSVATEPQWNILRNLLGDSIPPLPFSAATRETPDGDLAAQLAREFARRPADDWITALIAAGVPAMPVNPAVEVFDQAPVKANELGAELHHPQYGPIAQTGVLLKFSSTPAQLWCSAPVLGQHTREVLIELGYTPGQINELKTRQVILDGAT
jgi:crotonobetainyl-CoA:carnitine CoA-transferase CaiB-like acyl-CoA transferase